jgi:hypothetical protein
MLNLAPELEPAGASPVAQIHRRRALGNRDQRTNRDKRKPKIIRPKTPAARALPFGRARAVRDKGNTGKRPR